jgi:hypothetical protein
MTPITHALLPSLLAAPFLPRSTAKGYYGMAGLVALSGALPDVVNPHISLAARYSSWSHTALGFGGFAVILLVMRILRIPKGLSLRLVVLLSLAYLCHLFLDGISGGVTCFYPFSSRVYGARLIPWHNWLLVDAALVIPCLVAFRWLPAARWGARWGR